MGPTDKDRAKRIALALEALTVELVKLGISAETLNKTIVAVAPVIAGKAFE